MEFGIFNSLYLPHHLTDADPEHAEHNRLMDEVAWTRAADANGCLLYTSDAADEL